jgi:6-phosphogluconolactonase
MGKKYKLIAFFLCMFFGIITAFGGNVYPPNYLYVPTLGTDESSILLLSRVNIPQNNIYRIKTELPLEKAAEEYEKEIINFFQTKEPAFDLILLGVGKDGHTASLFPNSDLLTENKRLVAPVSPAGVPYVPRITVTYKVLNNAKNILFLSSYNDKKNIIDEIITNKEKAKEKYPAARVEARRIYFFSCQLPTAPRGGGL